MTEENFIPKAYCKTIENGSFSWASPSNIALVKYWGKKDHQIPENPSISFTLDYCKTATTLSFSKKETSEDYAFEIFLDGEKKEDFKPKINTFFKRIEVYLPFLKTYQFKIETSNSFPHSSGIASSASGMSALALCLVSLDNAMSTVKMSQDEFNQKASFLSRLGSGSACRSIEGDLVVWGEHAQINGSSNLFGIKYEHEVHPVFKKFQDTILLVDKGEKQVSSTVGHNLMHDHPFAKRRFEQAHDNISKLMSAFKTGDINTFIDIVESEALTLHAMMMTSMPYFILMKPNTLEIINKIWAYRANSESKICFTLDAGANVHVLYPEREKESALKFIKHELIEHCQNEHYITDQIGFGAKAIIN
ncbi:MAG: diphosphomevalonate decarboxylase [Psychroserpens sp.]|uniref:diphosphomevalonate/mevalonate 3,5-bisphosphate decarboxylase family protein n=1 Tax=Psychroserpens sp. TaxID=2020870 RepID=UPI003C793317